MSFTTEMCLEQFRSKGTKAWSSAGLRWMAIEKRISADNKLEGFSEESSDRVMGQRTLCRHLFHGTRDSVRVC